MQSRKFWVGTLAVTLAAVCAAPVAAAPLLGAKGAGRLEAEKWMLDDAEVVVILNVKEMLGSDVMKKGGTQQLKGLLKTQEDAQKLLEACGLDPFRDVDGILMTGTGASNPKDAKVRVVIRGNFNTTKMHAAAEKHAKAKPDDLKLLKEGTTQLYQLKGKDDQPVFAAFVDKATIVLTPSKEATVDAIKNGGKKAANLTREMKAALDRFGGKESVAMAITVTEEMKKAISKVPQIANLAPKLQTITAAVNLTDAAELNVVANTSDGKAAGDLLKVLAVVKATGELMVQSNEDLPPFVGDLIGAIKLSKEQSSTRLNLKVTKELIEKASKKN
jgi:hypothetical protein